MEWITPPYDDTKILTSNFDAATVAWGSPWRMPTKDDFEALMEACTGSKDAITEGNLPTLSTDTPTGGVYWLEYDQNYLPEYKGVAGVLFVYKTDTSKRIFFPATGLCANYQCNSAAICGNYWSSSLYTEETWGAYNLYFYSFEGIDIGSSLRWQGFAIRPVLDL